MTGKHSKKLVSIVMREARAKSFAKYLHDHNTKLLDGGHGMSYTYSIPEILCRPHSAASEAKPVFATSAILAVFDEFSTYGLMSQCKTSRGGVSVHLSTEIVEKSFAGQEVVIKTSSDKIGKALGFCTMELRTAAEGRLLARGKHIKYMPMGGLWDLLASATLLPVTLAVYEYLTTSGFGKFLLGLFSKKSKRPAEENPAVRDIAGVGAVFGELGLLPTAFNHESSSAATKAFEFRVGRHVTNLMGALHGGALAAAIEQACVLSRTQSGDNAPAHFVQSMEVRYLSPLKVICIYFCE